MPAKTKRKICGDTVAVAAELAQTTPAVWTALLDAAMIADHARGVYWRVSARDNARDSALRVVTRRLSRALERHPTSELSLALLRQYRSPTLCRTVAAYGLKRLSPALIAAVLDCDEEVLRVLAWTWRPHDSTWHRLIAAAKRRLLTRLECRDPSAPLACSALDTFVELTLETEWLADGGNNVLRKYPWGRRTLRAVARLARHHDMRLCAQINGPRRKCGVESWIRAACTHHRLTVAEAPEIVRIGRPLSLGLAPAPLWYGAPGVLGLVAADEVPDPVALATALQLSAKEWRAAELALAHRTVVRADHRLRSRLARSKDGRVQAKLVEDEPIATLGARLRRLMTIDPALALRAIEARADDAAAVLTRRDLLPLLRHPDDATRLAAQTLLHRLLDTTPRDASA